MTVGASLERVNCKAYLVHRDPLRDQQLLGLGVKEGLVDLWDLAPHSCLCHPENLWHHLGQGHLCTVIENKDLIIDVNYIQHQCTGGARELNSYFEFKVYWYYLLAK